MQKKKASDPLLAKAAQEEIAQIKKEFHKELTILKKEQGEIIEAYAIALKKSATK